jgi:hypothetical protein
MRSLSVITLVTAGGQQGSKGGRLDGMTGDFPVRNISHVIFHLKGQLT